MTWNPLQLRGISFISTDHDQDPALLELQSGLNVICGASDTGKSFIVEAIDFLLGAQSPLKSIPEREKYDRARLVLETTTGDVFTLERNTGGGQFRLFEGNFLVGDPPLQFRRLNPKHQRGKQNTLSYYILSTIGIGEQLVRKNIEGQLQSLTLRRLVRLAVVKEGEITKQWSPILSEHRTQQTSDYSVFKFLLTGVDDSALEGEAEKRAALASNRQNNQAKVEFIDELLQGFQTETNQFSINRTEAEVMLSQLEAQSEAQQEILNRIQGELNNRIDRRREIMAQIERWSNRINEIESLISRFELLEEHYKVDIQRLNAIEESGSLFVHLERTPCPLCGSLPNEQHHPNEQHSSTACDGDVASVVHAATAEIAKVEKLLRELDQTAEDLKHEAEELTKQQDDLKPQFQILNEEIQEISSPVREARNLFSEIVKQAADVKRVIDIFDRVEPLQAKKAELLAEIQQPIDDVILPDDLPSSLLDSFAEKVKNILQSWNFPESDRVHFDERTKDIIIGGQPRTSRGKGFKAITHAAMTIGLMEFCKERDLSHPGFVVLDSPLLAYYKPESLEDSLKDSDLKFRFYNYLADNHRDSQITIIENEHPPEELKKRIMFINFTKNPELERYGFFPQV